MPVDLRSMLALALTSAGLAYLLTVLVIVAALSQPSVTVILVLRALVVTLVLAVIAPALVRRRLRALPARAVLPTLLVGAVVGYVLHPLSWIGRTYLGQLLLDPGLATTLVDLVVWVLVTVAACTWWIRRGTSAAVSR